MNVLKRGLVAAGIFAMALPALAGHEVAVDRDASIEFLEGMLNDLDRMEELNERNSNKFSRTRITERIRAMRADLRKQRRALRSAPTIGEAPPPIEPPPDVIDAPAQMSTPEFSKFIAELKKASFTKEKIALIREVSRHNLFTTAQVIQVIKKMSFSDAKVDAAAILYPQVVDQQNFFQVYSHLPFDKDKKKLRERIGS